VEHDGDQKWEKPIEMNDTKCPVTASAHCCQWVFSKIDLLQPWFLLFLRLYIGYQSVVAGWAHLTHVDSTAQFFASLGIPMPRLNVYIAGGTEVVGGALLFVGLASRLVAIPFSFNFLIAILSVNLADPKYRDMLKNILHNQDVVLKDDAFPFLFVGVMIFIFGPGKFSLDHYVLRPLMDRWCKTPHPDAAGKK
jgi:putative oxidoreductase